MAFWNGKLKRRIDELEIQLSHSEGATATTAVELKESKALVDKYRDAVDDLQKVLAARAPCSVQLLTARTYNAYVKSVELGARKLKRLDTRITFANIWHNVYGAY